MVTITVSGPAGSGKSTIMELIANVLVSHDIKFEASIIQDEHKLFRDDSFYSRLESISEKIEQTNQPILLVEKQTYRNMFLKDGIKVK